MIELKVERCERLFNNEEKTRKLMIKGYGVGDAADFLNMSVEETVAMKKEGVVAELLAEIINIVDHPHTKHNLPRFAELLEYDWRYYEKFKNFSKNKKCDLNVLIEVALELSEVQRRILLEDFKESLQIKED